MGNWELIWPTLIKRGYSPFQFHQDKIDKRHLYRQVSTTDYMKHPSWQPIAALPAFPAPTLVPSTSDFVAQDSVRFSLAIAEGSHRRRRRGVYYVHFVLLLLCTERNRVIWSALFPALEVFDKQKQRCTPMAGEATRPCSQAAASCRRSHNRRRNTVVEAAGAEYVERVHLSYNAECVFCEMELCYLGRCVFKKGEGRYRDREGIISKMWNCTSELVIDCGVAKSTMSSLPLLCKDCFGPPFWLPVNSHLFTFCA